jgi:hypothetical protein
MGTWVRKSRRLSIRGYAWSPRVRCVGANPSANLVSKFDASLARNNLGTIRIPFHVFSRLAILMQSTTTRGLPKCFPWDFARLAQGLRDQDDANVLLHTGTAPEFDLLRADPRFQVLLRRIDVP